jgi:hypothetical protein
LAVAYTDSRLATAVKAGENRGEVLKHDHVVRAFDSRSLEQASTTVRVRLRRPAEPGTAPTLVAFVQDRATGDVLQSVTLPFQGCERS